MAESKGVTPTLDLVPEKTPYVYLTIDKSNLKSYIGSHNGKNRDYKGSGIIIQRILAKRPNDLSTIPLFWNSNIEIVRQAEESILKFFNAAQNPCFYNLKNSATGGNCLSLKTEEELQDIKDRRSRSMKKTISSRLVEVHLDIHRRQRESLMKNIENSKIKIRTSLSLRTKEQKLEQKLKNLRSRYLKGKIHLIEVFDKENKSKGIYFGTSIIENLFPISGVGVLVNIKSEKRIKQGNLVGWKFIKLPQRTWEEVEEYVNNSIKYAE